LKKTIASIIIIVLVFVGAASVLQPFFKPETTNAAFFITSDENGKFYMTERHADTSYIYRVDVRGNVDAAIEVGGEVLETTFMGGRLYYFVNHFETRRWTLEEAEANLSSKRQIGGGKTSLLGDAASLTSGTDAVYITGNNRAQGRLIVLAYSPEDLSGSSGDLKAAADAGIKGMGVYREISLQDPDPPIEFVSNGNAVYVLQADQRIAMISAEGVKTTEETFPNSAINCTNGRVYVRNALTHAISEIRDFPEMTVRYTYDRMQAGCMAIWNDGAVMLVQNEQGGRNLYFSKPESANTWRPIYGYDLSLRAQLQFKDFKPVRIWIVTLAIALALIFSLMFAIYVKRIVLRVCATISVLGCFMLAVLCFMVWRLAGDIALSEIDAAAGSVVHEYVSSEEVQVQVVFTAFSFGGVALLIAIAVAVFFTSVSLRPLRDLTKRINKFTEGDFAVDGMVSAKGDLGRMSRAVTEMGVSLAIKQYETDRMIDSYSRFVPRDADRLLGRAGIMDVNTGDVARVNGCIAIVSVENRERVMHTMDSNDYMIFVNNCFARIFACANRYKGALLSGEFLTSLPILFSEQHDSNRGDAVRFGIDIIDRLTRKDSSLQNPDFFVFLHETEFLYGVAGTQEKAFPFISSAELNFLYGCNAELRRLGIRMVATQEYFDNLERIDPGTIPGAVVSAPQTFAKRYIGLLQTQTGAHEYRLYEILDCLSDKERDLKTGYDDKVQNAIRLFYENDFYSAMVAFSSILKQNPMDGLVRWYAFACERYFNEGDAVNVRYNLLSADS
jgi:hypothetical protein